MFDDDDPVLARVRELARALPGSDEKISHGRPALFTKKIFAYYGGSVKVDGEYEQHSQCIVVLAETDEKRALLELDHVYAPAYLAAFGWVGVDIDETTDWSEIAELLDASYRLTAPKRLVEELDDSSSG